MEKEPKITTVKGSRAARVILGMGRIVAKDSKGRGLILVDD